MSSKVDTIQEKVIPGVMKFANSKIIMAVKDGVVLSMPLTVIGSLFLLIQNFPFPSIDKWQSFMNGVFGANWQLPFNQVNMATYKILALVFVFGIASQYAKNEGCDPVSSGILGIVSFMIVSPQSITHSVGDVIGNVKLKQGFTIADNSIIPTDWTGTKGMITAIIVGLIVGYVYSQFIKKDIVIHMPEGVPQGVVNAFASLIPAAVLIIGSAIVYVFFHALTAATFSEWVYKTLEIPLQGITDSLGGAIAIPLIISFFWWFGVHGATLASGVMQAIYTANFTANQDLVNKHIALVASGAGRNAHIIAQQFQDNFVVLGGSGITFGLVLSMVLFGRSQRSKTLGKLALVPGLFNINEPVLFGFPIVLNPFMFIPFIIVPLIAGLLTYCSIYFGLVPCFTGVLAPWTTPPIVSGLIVAGWRGAILQIVIMLISTVIYMPFFKAQDKIYAREEKASESVDGNGVPL